MQQQVTQAYFTHGVSSGPRQGDVKNPAVPGCLAVPVKGIAIKGERYSAGQAGTSHINSGYLG